ncbi:MAG: nitroreductase family protein [Promethearchaeota archaeon]
MKILGIDDEKCIKCLACVDDCVQYLFESPQTKIGDKKKVIFNDEYSACILCGHCIAICPTKAIIYKDSEEPVEFEEVKNPSTIVSYDDIMKIIRSRRSIRKFKEKPVPKEEIKAVLDAMRYAPTARNAQAWEYSVLTDPDKIKRVQKTTQKTLLTLRKALKFGKKIRPILPKSLKEEINPSNERSLDKFYEKVKKGIDRVFFNAPVVIIVYQPKAYGSETLIAVDSGIATAYGALAAQSRGLGTCWIGFAMIAISKSKKVKKWLRIPKGMIITGVMIMGYPAVKYHRLPTREPLKVSWNLK